MNMRKRIVAILLGIFLLSLPVMSRVHIRHIGPKKELTEEEKKEIDEKNNVFLVIGIIVFGSIFYFGLKNKDR